MLMKRIFNIIIAALLCTAVIGSTAYAVSRIGSSGQEVTNIQTRLKQWGYYTGSVDGVYGQKTADAVKSFQRSNGLTADGIAGAATLEKIGLPTGGSSSGGSSQGSSSRDVQLLAQAINGEARGESYTGQVAVGAVILNRVRHSSFPNTIAGVIYQPGAFTAVSDGQINLTPQTSCYNAARDALNGWDPTGGAIYYYNPVTATNQWIRSRPIIITIGKHVFCK
ncbi:MAG: spore cortex-lytic enzyme [Clostridia bacterium]|nr:spore cortex-lytic enzyme [Clostridia bacterium]MBQ2669412.1 spore cortex-lytic enzyme [Clostridia bacterium]MBQ3471349.1 spore cortex-lytic enzyme [Clostridia bacterium]MBQ6530810.1 spore cortex-lytic enzyme [Clostridia bacterium]MBQ6557937.1 spore cortex-lytic enzyme [Clostridia bacterium]